MLRREDELEPSWTGSQIFHDLLRGIGPYNHKIISTSQTYASIENAKIGIESIRKNCTAHVEDQMAEGYEASMNPKFEIFLDVSGRPWFRLKASYGEIIAVSQAYTEIFLCLNGIESVSNHAPNAEIVIDSEPEGE